ncbi:uracil-DNA glycosylase, family 4 [Burkholderiales bacterium JOSHI_001]|nr:uracil-DNA glycosylase, family 4 [Burkholderiales bacterium JOSHI_001]
MRWSERQREMLRQMGVVMWSPQGEAAGEAPAAAPPAPEAPAPVRTPVAPPPAPRSRTPVAAASAVALPTDPARAAHVAALAWPELREAVSACQACALCQGRRQTVFGVGHERAHWMIVGEAPGEQEDRLGEPFVGAAGQLLDRMLQALGLTRSGDGEPAPGPERQVYIANTLKCRPPGNRNPAPEELAACDPFLQRQIALVQPRIVLAMGRFAVQSLLGTGDAIGKLRGTVHRLGATPVVVTYHPAYLLRSPADKAKSWADLCLAASVLTR